MPRYLVPVSYQAIDYIPVDAADPADALRSARELVIEQFGHSAEAGVCEWVVAGTPVETTASFTMIDAGLSAARMC